MAPSKASPKDDRAVSDVLGSILLVGITVGMTTGLAIMIFMFKGPASTHHANIGVSLDPGLGGWNSNDESIRIRHLGGDRLERGWTLVTYRINNGAIVQVTGSQLTGAFSDGTLSAGETWSYPVRLTGTDTVKLNVVDSKGSGSRLLYGTSIVPSTLGSGPACTLDSAPPTVQQWTQNPTDLRTTTIAGAVAITVTAQDDCHGVKTSVTPQLWYRINDGTSPAYVQAAAMTFTSGTTWSGTIPSQVWALQGGKTLQYQVRLLTDNGNNAGTVQGVDDLIDIITQYTYIGCPVTATTGTVTNCANMQEANSATTASVNEAASGSVAQAQVQRFGATAGGTGAVVGASCTITAANCALTQNTQYTRLDTATDTLTLTGFTVPAGANGITQVILGVVAKKVDSNNPIVRVTYSGQSTADPSPVTQTFSTTTDTTFETDVTADRAWTVANIGTLVVQLDGSGGNIASTRRVDVDVVYIKIVYTMPSYSLLVQGGMTGVPLGSTQVLQTQYFVTGETFNLQVCQDALPVCATWLTRATLSSTTTNQLLYTLTTAEYNSGAPRVRVTDVTPTATTAGSITIDYVRVATT